MKVPILTDQLSLPQPGGGEGGQIMPTTIILAPPDLQTFVRSSEQYVVTYETAITDMTHTILAKSTKILVCTLILNT